MGNKKVLIITIAFSPNIGGLETHQDDFCAALIENDYSYTVLTYKPLMTKLSANTYESGRNFEIYRFSWFGHGWFHKLEKYPTILFLYMAPALFVRSIIYMCKNHSQVDYIHAQGFMMSSIAKFLKFVFRKKTFVTLHALFDDLYDLSNKRILTKILSYMLSNQDGVITFSHKSAEEVIRLGVSREKIITTPHWVDIDRFSPKNRRDLESISSNFHSKKIKILFVGRYLEKKGVEVLLEAAQIFKDEVEFLFAGSGPLDKIVQNCSNKMKNVINFGAVDYAQIHKIYWQADVLIIPSLYAELFGRVIAEALASGLPVIGTNIGSIPTIINENVGWLAEPNKQSIIDVIGIIVNDQSSIKKKSKTAVKFAKDNFSSKNARVIFDKYEEFK